MTNTLIQWLNTQVPGVRLRGALNSLLTPVFDRESTQGLVSGAIAIHGTGSPTAKTGSDWYGLVKGKLVKLAAADLPALSGTVANGTYNVFAWFIDAGGTVTAAMGTAGATIGAIVFPPIPQAKACLGFVLIHPTGTGNFVGGTTNLDDATVVPNAVYVNTLGPFEPTVLVG